MVLYQTMMDSLKPPRKSGSGELCFCVNVLQLRAGRAQEEEWGESQSRERPAGRGGAHPKCSPREENRNYPQIKDNLSLAGRRKTHGQLQRLNQHWLQV